MIHRVHQIIISFPNPAEPEPNSKLALFTNLTGAKLETNPKFEWEKIQNEPHVRLLVIRISCFEFVSDFEIRISDFVTVLRRISVIRY